MSLHVLAAGALMSVQDRGRQGLRKYGVSAAGPMDAPALALANALCGNAPDAAALEFAGLGGTFTSNVAVHFAVTGGDCAIHIADQPARAGKTHRLDPGEVLKIGSLKDAAWGYLAIAGGIQTPCVMGARSTHLRFGLGGLDGRALRAGDRLPVAEAPRGAPLLCMAPARTGANLDHGGAPIRILPGPQNDHFAPDVLARLVGHDFTVTSRRDRMATLLDGPALVAAGGHDIVSDGTVPGAVQVPGSGNPIVLMAECQTTGGYPKIATIITADLARFAQMPTGRRFRFQLTDRTRAEDAARQHAADVQGLLDGLAPKSTAGLSSAYLLSCDLVGGIAAPSHIMGHDASEAPGS